MPLIEIVTNPDFNSPIQVEKFMRKLRDVLRYTDVCDGDLEKGSMRCDANVSVRKKGAKELGTRVEVKNINSFKNINKAIIVEAHRQVALLEDNQEIVQETRLYDANLDQTRSMRKKEEAHDYRYFPDPDLLPLKISSDFIAEVKSRLPELPDQKRERYLKTLGITVYDAEVITADKDVAEFFEYIVQKTNPKLAANWMCVELFGRLNKHGLALDSLPIKVSHFVFLLQLIDSGHISGTVAKDVLDMMFEKDEDPRVIVEKHNLAQVSDFADIEQYVEQVLNSNPEKVAEFKGGKDKLLGFFVGQIMKISEGKANPQIINEILIKQLQS
jgi:aspartyl-tRNA(Asn)/glutamyl-tRNA(Gln) amidotransferase subunit B